MTIAEPAPINIPAIKNIIFIINRIINLEVLPNIASINWGILARVITYPSNWPAANRI